eukprot:TRINITY_DN7683_c0_g1_i1.p1 TRINITY_DN7683_c0_g1~~TRINITY_DN7683_c0_g1_i1.p1  ORF type:complete len:404 (-),score=118.10 TRINITY_DN7683_c0_g1_i1:820-2031(-)
MSVVLALSDAGKVDGAMELLDEMSVRGVAATSKDYVMLLDRFGCERAMALLHHMESHGVVPDFEYYAGAMGACTLRVGLDGVVDLDEASNLLQWMLDKGISDFETWTMLLEAYGRVGQADRMLDAYKAMCACARRHAAAAATVDADDDGACTNYRARPLVDTIDTMLEYAANLDSVHVAEYVWEEFGRWEGLQTDGDTVGKMARVLANAGELEKAEKLHASTMSKHSNYRKQRTAREAGRPRKDTDGVFMLPFPMEPFVLDYEWLWMNVIDAAHVAGDAQRADELYELAMADSPDAMAFLYEAQGGPDQQRLPRGTVLQLQDFSEGGLGFPMVRPAVRYELDRQARQLRDSGSAVPLYIVVGEQEGAVMQTVLDAVRSKERSYEVLQWGDEFVVVPAVTVATS